MTVIHGGRLDKISEQYQIPISQWLDLSTGIAPLSYPIPEIPLQLWQQLPQENKTLITAAKQYYQCQQLLVTNGSQSIIKILPSLWQKHMSSSKRVYLPSRGYKEHIHAWQGAGYQISLYQDNLPPIEALEPNCVLVVINPNNPTGKLFDKTVLETYQIKLIALNGLFVIDEAFMDVLPSSYSMCSLVNNNHTLVLRSFGKFFGLAGIRIGFLIANDFWHQKFTEALGPWQVNGPAQLIAQHALLDRSWQSKQCINLNNLRRQQEIMLWDVLGKELILDIKGTDLFLTIEFQNKSTASCLYDLLCQHSIYCRLSDEKDTIRFGITTLNGIKRLSHELKNINN